MNKLFKLAQTKGKWHKFLSFNLGGGAKLYKNFAQKLLAVSLCMAMVLLGTPVTTFADGEKIEAILSLSASASGAAVTCTLTDKDGAALDGYYVLMRVTDGDGSPTDYLFQTDARGVVAASLPAPVRALSRTVAVFNADTRAEATQVSRTFTAWGLSFFDDTGAAIEAESGVCRAVQVGDRLAFSAVVDAGGAAAARVTWSVRADSDSASVASIDALTGVLSVRGFGTAVVEAGFAGDPVPCAKFYLLLQDQGFLESTVDVNGQQQRLRVYDPNGVLPEGTTLTAEAVTAHEFIDDDHEIEHLLSYNISLLDAAGDALPMPLSDTVELCFEVLDGLDRDELEVVLVKEFDDAEFEENLVDLDGASWVKVKTNHFSPYALIDKLTPEEKGVQVQDDPGPKNNVKTGDHAVQVAVAGLGMTLVLALGVMLRLITSRKKFYA